MCLTLRWVTDGLRLYFFIKKEMVVEGSFVKRASFFVGSFLKIQKSAHKYTDND